MNLLCLLLSCLFLFRFFSLCLCFFSLFSFCLCLCGVEVVLLLWVVVCVICGVCVCPLNTSPCVPVPRAHVSTCARGAGIHGDLSNVHTETLECFSLVKQVFFYISRASQRDVGFIPYRQFFTYQKLPTYGLSRASEVQPILRMERGQHIPCTVQLDAQSMNAQLLPVATYSSYEAGRTKDKDRHNNDISTTPHRTKPNYTTPHHTTPNNQQRLAHDMTRHHTTKK